MRLQLAPAIRRYWSSPSVTCAFLSPGPCNLTPKMSGGRRLVASFSTVSLAWLFLYHITRWNALSLSHSSFTSWAFRSIPRASYTTARHMQHSTARHLHLYRFSTMGHRMHALGDCMNPSPTTHAYLKIRPKTTLPDHHAGDFHATILKTPACQRLCV